MKERRGLSLKDRIQWWNILQIFKKNSGGIPLVTAKEEPKFE
jgi:hypothetical protein